MKCPRCRGRMIAESFTKVYGAMGIPITVNRHTAQKCILCGELIDPVIASNRLKSSNNQMLLGA